MHIIHTLIHICTLLALQAKPKAKELPTGAKLIKLAPAQFAATAAKQKQNMLALKQNISLTTLPNQVSFMQ